MLISPPIDRTPQVLPPEIAQFLYISEVDDAQPLLGDLFQRKFGDPPPAFGRHLIAFYKNPNGSIDVLGYSHMRPFGDVYLSGGSCTDGNVYRAMEPEQRQLLADSGGVWYFILKYAFDRYADCCDAFFGYTGDPRAIEVAYQAGWVDTGHPHVMAVWHKELHPVVKKALTAKVVALGPF